MRWLHQHRYLVLVFGLGGTYIAQSADQGLTGGWIASDAILALIMLAVLFVVFERRLNRVIALCLAVAGITTRLAFRILTAEELQLPLTVVHYVLLVLFLGYAVAVILGHIFTKSTVSTDDILGAVSGYLIAGAAWSSLYALTDALAPGSFTIASTLNAHLSSWHGRTALFNYFSIVTLTTMGYGDVTPSRAPATSFAMLEAVFGQFYIAVVVAQLVSARMTAGISPESGD
jgi:hypothetical protein